MSQRFHPSSLFVSLSVLSMVPWLCAQEGVSIGVKLPAVCTRRDERQGGARWVGGIEQASNAGVVMVEVWVRAGQGMDDVVAEGMARGCEGKLSIFLAHTLAQCGDVWWCLGSQPTRTLTCAYTCLQRVHCLCHVTPILGRALIPIIVKK